MGMKKTLPLFFMVLICLPVFAQETTEAPNQDERQPRLQRGTYTFNPKLQAKEGDELRDAWISKVVVERNRFPPILQYVYIYIESEPGTIWANTDVFKVFFTGEFENVYLTNLDTGKKHVFRDEWYRTKEYLVFPHWDIEGSRFSLTSTHVVPGVNKTPWVFEEIILEEPDARTRRRQTAAAEQNAPLSLEDSIENMMEDFYYRYATSYEIKAQNKSVMNVAVLVRSEFQSLTEYITDTIMDSFKDDKRFRIVDHRSQEDFKMPFLTYEWGRSRGRPAKEGAEQLKADIVITGTANYLRAINQWELIFLNYGFNDQKDYYTISIYDSSNDDVDRYNRIEASGTLVELVPEINPNAERDPFIYLSTAFTWYAKSFDSSLNYPYGRDETYNYNLQLSMGFELFKFLNTFLDFNFKNTDADKILNIAGKLGTKKWFGIALDYHNAGYNINWNDDYLNGNLEFWEPPNASLKTDELKKGEQSLFTMGIMLPYKNLWGFGLAAGFAYSHAKGWVDYTVRYEDPELEKGLYLETDNPINVYGVRITLAPVGPSRDLMLGEIYGSNNPWAIIAQADLDICFGKLKPQQATINAIKADGGDILDDYFLMFLKARLLLGLAYDIPFTLKRGINFGLGVDWNYYGFLDFVSGDGKAEITRIPQLQGIGIFARIKIRL